MAKELYAFDDRNSHRVAETVKAFEAGLRGDGPFKRPIHNRDYALVPFRNDAAETSPAHGVARVISSIENEDEVIYTVGKPNATFQRRYLVIGEEDVEEDGFGWGYWLWHADYVLYDDANAPAFGETWGPTDNSWKIIKDMYGFVIQGNNITTAPKRTKAIQEPVQYLYGKADAEMTALGGSGTVSVWKGKFASDSSVNITATNETGIVIESGARCRVNTMAGRDIAEPFECPTP